MKNLDLIPFKSGSKEIRSVLINKEPWFVAKDVAKALGYKNTNDAIIKNVYPEDTMGSQITTPNPDKYKGSRKVKVVNESGMYALIFGSKMEKAKEFKRWVTSEVLPSIRKYGAYMRSHSHPHPIQKSDRDMEVLKIIESMLIKGDRGLIARDLGVAKSTVTHTLKGLHRNKNIIEKCFEYAKNNIEQGAFQGWYDGRFLDMVENVLTGKPNNFTIDKGTLNELGESMRSFNNRK